MAALTATIHATLSSSPISSQQKLNTPKSSVSKNVSAFPATAWTNQVSAARATFTSGDISCAFGRRTNRKSGHVCFAAAGETSPEEYDAEIAADGSDDVGVSDVNQDIDIEDEVVPASNDLKLGLIDSLYGTERGLKASSDTRAEIIELITQLEAANPTPAPTEAADILNGKWILAYTSYSELYPLLAAGNLPFVEVGEISQTINATAGILSNQVTFSSPVSSSTFTTEASFEIRSPKRLQVKFEETVISAPKMSDDVDVPASVEVFGQTVDLTQFSGVIKPLQDAAASIVRTISGQPPLKVPIRGDASSWLLTTYLDADLRISRGDGGGIFVLIKAGSPLLTY